ncbi:hypothetical protein [Comamonas sp.]|uniref:hypothetical protein n=1 Tax=Comamonas sp. TaxID=34028 RepID=UPI002899B60B|nr:hypothetical protein [Comamonas sp.]
MARRERRWPGDLALVTTGMLPVGLLTAIAAALGIFAGQAGWMMSLPALLAAMFAPLEVLVPVGSCCCCSGARPMASVALMTWMMKAAPQAMEVAAGLYAGVFNTGIALGVWGRGTVVDACGLSAMLWPAAAWRRP